MNQISVVFLIFTQKTHDFLYYLADCILWFYILICIIATLLLEMIMYD